MPGRPAGKAGCPELQAPCCNGGKMLKMGVKTGETSFPKPNHPCGRVNSSGAAPGLDGAVWCCPTSFSVRGGTFSSRSMPFTTTPFFSLTGALKTILDVLL